MRKQAHLDTVLSSARAGSRDASRLFHALGITIDPFKSADDLMPTVNDRLSQIPNLAMRTAVELRLFGFPGVG